MPNKRFDERLPTRNVVLVRHQHDVSQRVEYLQNISHGGLSFYSLRPWQRDSVVHVVIQTDQNFELQAVVRWCQTQLGGYEIGLAFANSPDETMIASLQDINTTLALYQATSIVP